MIFQTTPHAVVLCLVAMAGCRSSGRLGVTEPELPARNLGILLVQAASNIQDARQQEIQLEATVAALARQTLAPVQVFTKRDAPAAVCDLRVEITIVSLERVTPEARNRVGMLAGRAHIRADVMLRDVTSGVVVATFTAEGRSSPTGVTEQAIKRASEQIVEGLKRYVTFTASPPRQLQHGLQR